MGYTTNFTSKFTISPPLDADQTAYLQALCNTRRMARKINVLKKMPDPLRLAVGLPLGEEGEYFVGGGGWAGQDHDVSIIDYNDCASTQHGLWCKWTVTDNGKHLQWSGAEKFYAYEDWLKYIAENFLKPWGKTLNGDVKWRGEDNTDRGVLIAQNNNITSLSGPEFVQYKEQKRAEKLAKKEKDVILKELPTANHQKSISKI